MSNEQSMGLVGLGVMGRNLALNIADKGIRVVAYDPWENARSGFRAALAPAQADSISVVDTPAEMVMMLPAPRIVLVMVKAGEPVDQVIASLLPLLSVRDTLIDGGNSHYQDSIRRHTQLSSLGVHFVGLGISGGEEGARNGPSLMAGGTQSAYDRVSPILESLAARFDGTPCCARVGGDGAGHFVKMVHNGIEYGVMQLIAEAYVLLRDVCGLDHAEMADVFERWNDTELASYLVEITARILLRKDEFSDAPLVEMILDKAGQKGTGRWSSEAALELGSPSPTITEAVFARALASLKEQRVAASALLEGPVARPMEEDRAEQIERIRQALLGAILATYAQGLAVIEAAGGERGWAIDLAVVASIWRAGCVIRADLLDGVMRAYGGMETPQNLMCAPVFARILAATQESWRRTVASAVTQGIPVPGFSSALAYYDGYRTPRLWANMIQAQRDCFGAHTYERIDRPGSFHSDW